ncbi:MAG: heme-binding protein [Flavitalea sp.]
MNITLVQAQAAIEAAKKKAAEIDTKMNICVVDAGSNPVAFVRMDGAWIGSVDISFKKAKTAAWFTMDTAVLTPLVQPGGSLYNIEHSNGGLITFPGGVFIKNAAGEPIGAIGVSGSSVENDHAVALAGAAAVK